MSGMSIDGLVSGLDTTALVSQLMQLEKQPQVRLQARKTSLDALANLYRQINTKLDAVKTAAGALNMVGDWNVTKATSSDEDLVSVRTSGTAAAGSISFTVESLASAKTVASSGTVTGAATFAGGFTVNGVQIDDVGTGTLAEVASAITNSTAGVSATVVKVGTDQYRLQLAAKTNGSGTTIDVQGLDGGLVDFSTVVAPGSLASLHVGTAPDGYTVTSDTNTVTDLLSGTTLTLHKADPTTQVTVGVAVDPEAIADKVNTLVTAVNDTLKLIKDNSRYDANTKKAGPLLSNQITATLSRDLARALTDAVPGADLTGEGLGIKVDRYGVATFDRATFLAAYEADPDSVRAFFTDGSTTVGDTTDDGLAERLRAFTTTATSLATGPMHLALDGLQRTTKSLDDQIASWDQRLALREAALKRQFTAMEAALGQAQSMSSWLSGQIASLPTIA